MKDAIKRLAGSLCEMLAVAYKSEDDGWKPIETAPKNEKILIVTRGGFVYAAFRNLETGDVAWLASEYGEHQVFCHATHWRPLPKPPRAK